MTLILDLIGPPRLMGARQRFELQSGSATVGRSPEADWVIPDYDRMISRRHLRVDANGRDYVLTDTSANGVFINDSEIPVGHGAFVKLRDEDRIRIGEAEIAVTIRGLSEDDAAAAASAAETGATRLRADRDPFGGPFAASPADASQSRDRPGATAEIIDANWMIQPIAAPGADRGGSAVPRSAAAPVAALPPSLSALVAQHPDLTPRRLAEVVETAARDMNDSAWQAMLEGISRLLRSQP